MISLSQEKIDNLLSMMKTVKNPHARVVIKGQHEQVNYYLIGSDEETFNLYTRQNVNDSEDFSCGLSWNTPSGDVLTLARYNGPSHPHKNQIENQKLDFVCHVHKITTHYVDAGKKAEGFAEETDRYETLSGALHCLVTDCKVSGIETAPDAPRLFTT
jgi:hypothetical protein